MTALRSPACFTDDGTIWAYTRDRGYYRNHDSWIMIEKLNRNSYYVTRDGGVLLLSYCHELDNTNINHYILTKFPAVSFEGISEAHDYGLKVAIAYPNPGNNVLNIRTGLPNAHVEIYDLNGKLIHNTEISHIISIKTDSWPSGTYIWKVISNGKLAESGKWIKE